MKHLPKLFLLVASLSLTGAASAGAQSADPQQQPAPAPAVHAHHEHSPQHETRKLTRKLGLSPDQAAQIEPILAAKHEQMQALKSNPPADPQQMHQQMRSIAQSTREKIDAILTEPQREQMAAMRHHHRGMQQEAPAAPVQ